MGTSWGRRFGYDDTINCGCDASAARAKRKIEFVLNVCGAGRKSGPLFFPERRVSGWMLDVSAGQLGAGRLSPVMGTRWNPPFGYDDTIKFG